MTSTETSTQPDEAPPPRALTSIPGKPGYHPACLRVGVRINGVARNDVIAYDQDAGTATLRGDKKIMLAMIEPFWRHPESRQQRRARERWESRPRANAA